MGTWSDVYSLGVVFYKMLTGRLPFEGPTLALIFKAVHESAPPPSHFRENLDPGLDAVVLKALARQPEDRYHNARQFAEALEKWRTETVTPTALTTHPQVCEPVTTAIQSDLPDGGSVNVTIDHPKVAPGKLKVRVSKQQPGKRKRRRLTISITLAFSLLVALTFAGIWISEKYPAERRLGLRDGPPAPRPAPPVIRQAERFGGIEIGSRGVNYVHFGVFPDDERVSNWQILDNDSAKTDLTKGMGENGDFDAQRFGDTVQAVRFFYDCLRKQHLVRPDKIFIVASSSLPKAFLPRQGGDKAAVVQMRKRALTEAVEKATGKRMEFIDVDEELHLQIRGAALISDHHKALYVDVGTGNTRGGYLKRSGLLVRFEGPGTYDTFKNRWAGAELRERFRKGIRTDAGVRAAEKVYLAGGIAWVMTTYLHPSERGTYVTIQPKDIDRFAEAVKDKDYVSKFVPPPVLGAKETKKLKEDVQMIQEIFPDHDYLVAGAEVLKALAAELEFSKKELRFFRYSHLAVLFAWVYEKSGHKW
jgi:hypothetical protein